MKKILFALSTFVCILASAVLTGCSLNPFAEKAPASLKASEVYPEVASMLAKETPMYITYSVIENGQSVTYFTSDADLIKKCVKGFKELRIAELELIPNYDNGSVITFYGSKDSITGSHKMVRIELEDGYYMSGQSCFVAMADSFTLDDALNTLTQSGIKTDYSPMTFKEAAKYDATWEGTNNRIEIYLDADGFWYIDTIERTEPEFTTIAHEKILSASTDSVTVEKEDGTTEEYSLVVDSSNPLSFNDEVYWMAGID